MIPHPDDVMREALRGAGFTGLGMSTGERLWRHLLPEVEYMEMTSTLANGTIDEAAISGAVRAVTEGILARRRYAAGLKAQAKTAKKDAKKVAAKRRPS